MKCIVVRQPWAWLILHAGKDIENRDWPTHYRGPMLILAGKGMTRKEYEGGLATAHWVSERRPFPAGLAMPRFEELPRGGIVGRVDVVDCVKYSDSPWYFGDYGFVLRNATPLPFVPWSGQLKFFDVPDDYATRAVA